MIPLRLYTPDLNVLRQLVAHFSGPEVINHQVEGLSGSTALHWAVLRLYPEAVKVLLQAGADSELVMSFATNSATAREIAYSLNEDHVPAEAKERGPHEVQGYLRRMEELRSKFDEHS